MSFVFQIDQFKAHIDSLTQLDSSTYMYSSVRNKNQESNVFYTLGKFSYFFRDRSKKVTSRPRQSKKRKHKLNLKFY